MLKRYSFFSLLFAVIISACTTEDKCKTTQCPTNAYCSFGDCRCFDDYEGENCETLVRDKMIGTYKGATDIAYYYPGSTDTIARDTGVIVIISEGEATDSKKTLQLKIVNGQAATIYNYKADVSGNKFIRVTSGHHGNMETRITGSLHNGNMEFIYESAGVQKTSFIGIKQK